MSHCDRTLPAAPHPIGKAGQGKAGQGRRIGTGPPSLRAPQCRSGQELRVAAADSARRAGERIAVLFSQDTRPGCKGFRTTEAMVERDLRGRCPNGGWAVLLALEARRNGISGEWAGIGICRAA